MGYVPFSIDGPVIDTSWGIIRIASGGCCTNNWIEINQPTHQNLRIDSAVRVLSLVIENELQGVAFDIEGFDEGVTATINETQPIVGETAITITFSDEVAWAMIGQAAREYLIRGTYAGASMESNLISGMIQFITKWRC